LLIATYTTRQLTRRITPNTQSSKYWSSTTNAMVPGYAWYVDFSNGGYVYLFGYKLNQTYVRAVRGGQTPQNFINNGDGTVTDTSTGLMWQKDTAPGTYTWQQALSYCENLILNNDGQWTNGTPNSSGAKYSNWRLPNRNELQSLVDYGRYNPAINTDYFSDTVPCDSPLSCSYWSSTTSADYPSNAWGVCFACHGGVVNGYGKADNYYVRAGGTY